MRAKHPTHPQAPATACRDGGRPGRGWLPRPRAVAAGGALLVQLWGVGLGAGCAQATTVTPGPATAGAHRAAGPDSVQVPSQRRPQPDRDRPADQDASPPPGPEPERGAGAGNRSEDGRSGDPVGQLTDAVPALEGQAAPVDRLLQERIRAGGLPLPGQGKAVPDAFAIAAVLLPAAPSEPREEDGPRASRDAPAGVAEDGAAPAAEPVATAGPEAPPARPGAPAAGAKAVPAAERVPASAEEPGVGRPPAPARPRPVADLNQDIGPDLGADSVAGSPVGVGTAGTSAAVLVPITAGLLLTGAAMYKHRGLPKGH
ncbi:hypothetical protein [Streptomyces sp. CB03911]|uniref:hypothetical protein n=1 Tax=Streptomyces sp. CB03911 TaxID=1804758 RepID=UPI00093A10C0|nr:hypothetical protein [Streptomyces sp. CB03911]OKI28515.1 hypothetical protein A6A07_27215 [Streptomyces sp. CB03911]